MGFWKKFTNLLGNAADSESVDLKDVQRLIGYQFSEPTLLLLALTHRSYSYAHDQYSKSNERLEFLGDSVLGLVIAEQLYRDHTEVREGDLTKMKALLVSETTLAELGIRCGLNKHMLLAPEEERSGGRTRHSIVSDAFESVLGAVFLDGGLEAARKIINKLIYSAKDDIAADSSRNNFKGELLERIQARGEGMPHYEVVSESGPDHDKVFHVDVHVNGRVVGTGQGHTKKEAEQKAAGNALGKLSD
ncbi:MAG: ribonuclease III [candidate division Zixibacteria bacterium]|nr:ribonuclease III [candidate division Zixibacteria bacterium]